MSRLDPNRPTIASILPRLRRYLGVHHPLCGGCLKGFEDFWQGHRT